MSCIHALKNWRRFAHKKNYAWASLGFTLLFYASLWTLHSLLPSVDMENVHWRGTLLHADGPASGGTRTLWVFLPLLGLKYARRSGYSEQQHRDFMLSVQKERVTVQSWGLVADTIRTAASTSASFADVRIVGLVGQSSDCDPWLNAHATECYQCLALPPQCLGRDYDEVPMVDCIFSTILNHVGLRHNSDDVIIYTNGDLVFPSSKLLAILSHVYCRQDADNKKDAVLVGQRRDTPLMDGGAHDFSENGLLEGISLTADNFHAFFYEALSASVLHADFGVDYFVLPARVLSTFLSTRAFPPFLVGRYRWDNALLACFILDEIAAISHKTNSSNGIRTIDVTSALPVVHLGQHSASPDYFQAQLGADYNDRVAHEHFGELFMLGRIHNTEWILSEGSPINHHQGIPSSVYELVARAKKIDADLLQAFDRAYYHHHRRPLSRGRVALQDVASTQGESGSGPANGLRYPIILLITVLPRDVPYAVSWMQYRDFQSTPFNSANAEMRDHSLFVTVDQDSYNELNAAYPGNVILEKAFVWPSSAVKWHSFSRLLRNRLTVGIMSARDAVDMSKSGSLLLLWQQTLSAKCGAVLYKHSDSTIGNETDEKDWDVFSIRPSPEGTMIWDELQKDGRGNDEQRLGLRSLFALSQPNKLYDEKACVVDLHAIVAK